MRVISGSSAPFARGGTCPQYKKGALSYPSCKMEDCRHTTVRRQLGTVALKGERSCSSVIFTVMTTSIW